MEQKLSFDYQKYNSLKELPAEDKALVEKAMEACKTSYAKYSGFRVGAAARLKSGMVITGSNQESEVFPAGICAERNLLFHYQAHLAGDPIEALAIASVPSERECYPCGMCRQVLVDTEKRQSTPMRVIMSSGHSASVVGSAKDLLPFTFEL